MKDDFIFFSVFLYCLQPYKYSTLQLIYLSNLIIVAISILPLVDGRVIEGPRLKLRLDKIPNLIHVGPGRT